MADSVIAGAIISGDWLGGLLQVELQLMWPSHSRQANHAMRWMAVDLSAAAGTAFVVPKFLIHGILIYGILIHGMDVTHGSKCWCVNRAHSQTNWGRLGVSTNWGRLGVRKTHIHALQHQQGSQLHSGAHDFPQRLRRRGVVRQVGRRQLAPAAPRQVHLQVPPRPALLRVRSGAVAPVLHRRKLSDGCGG